MKAILVYSGMFSLFILSLVQYLGLLPGNPFLIERSTCMHSVLALYQILRSDNAAMYNSTRDKSQVSRQSLLT